MKRSRVIRLVGRLAECLQFSRPYGQALHLRTKSGDKRKVRNTVLDNTDFLKGDYFDENTEISFTK